MLIDWYTVGAQALNFLILVWLMKHFLYKPILHAIDEREKRIAAELADAATKQAEAHKEREDFQHKNEELDQQRAALLSQATDEAKAERQRLIDEARNAADALSAKRQEALRNDAHHLNQAIGRRAQQEVFAIARKTLTDLATTSLEERMGEVFTRRLRELDGPAKQRLADAFKTASDPALVRTAFDLPPDQRSAIQNSLNETFAAEVRVRFETAPELVSGIELTTNGQKVAWSIADYLASLEKGVAELLKEQDKPEAKAKPKPEAKAKPKPEAKAAPTPEAEAAPKPNVESTPKPEAKAESKVDEATPKPEAKAAPTPEAKAEPTPEAKAEPKAKAAPKSNAEAAPKPEAKAKPKAETTPKPDAEAAPKPEARGAPKPEVRPAPEPPTKSA